MPQSSTPETSSGAPAVRLDAGVEVEELTDELGRRYVVGEELGRGVLTVVRSALLREVDGPPLPTGELAIKTVLPLWIGHPLAEARIAREREVSDAVHAKSDLQPVPCARVLAAGRQRWGSSRAGQAGRSRPFHVSQRLVGSSLAEVLRRREREPSPARALRWALDLCDALDGMHRVGWVHRDLKPQNIFILEPADRVTLIDFGLALPIGGTPGEADEPFGTPAYVSPESIAGAPLDPRADLYSLGLVMFELFSGRRPFATRDPIALLDAHLSEDPPPLRSLVPTCSVELDAIVAETLGKDPAERPADVAELTARLRSAPEARLGNGTSGQSCLK